jgi:flagellar export protein FliJ
MAPKFSLQNVLDLRHGKVELLETELGKLLAACQETETFLGSLKAGQTSLLERLNAAQSGDIDLFKMNLIRENLLHLQQRIEITARDLAHQKQAADAKRAELVKAKQDEETLEILKKKRYEVYQAEQVQAELRVQDDIYIARAFRNQQQGVQHHG